MLNVPVIFLQLAKNAKTARTAPSDKYVVDRKGSESIQRPDKSRLNCKIKYFTSQESYFSISFQTIITNARNVNKCMFHEKPK